MTPSAAFCLAQMGPFKIFGSSCRQLPWAHTTPSAALHTALVGLFKIFGSSSRQFPRAHTTPLGAFWPAAMGPFKSFGSYRRQCCLVNTTPRQLCTQLKWAHPSSSAAFKGSSNGPIHHHWELSKAAQMGPFIIMRSFQR